MSSNELMRQSSEMSVWDRFGDSMTAVKELGKTFWQAGVGGAKTEQQGQVLALACLSEKQNPFKLTARHHIMDGKLSLKSDVMLADFNSAGGKHVWLKDGDDGIAAELELTHPDGHKLVSTFSFEDAKSQGLPKQGDKGGNRWTKGPKAVGEMLRARCTSRGIRMLMPSIVAGCYAPEELEDGGSTTAEPAKRGRPPKEKTDVTIDTDAICASQGMAPRGEVIEPTVTVPVLHVEDPPFEVPDRPAAVESKPVAVTDAPAEKIDTVREVFAEADTKTEIDQIRADIRDAIKKMNCTEAQLNGSLVGKNPAWKSLENVPIDDARRVLEHLQKALSSK